MSNDYRLAYQMRKELKPEQASSFGTPNDPTKTEVKPEDFKLFGKYGSGQKG
jgi:hypothetical protein